ncbi:MULTISPECIES: hypothetical protein [unclassified Oceanobacillus]|nr:MULTISPECIES: hypothetical protein [unclassified Oceanobacillus]MBT2600900.1 hypothetical protein [Oceanobacillus sp. ISL-74]MBT2653439.1 hypothetical protein [Oceanobacillus sp. ISL-73]
MYEFYIEYESYLGQSRATTVNADTESDARRIFAAQRPLSDITNIEKLG